MHCLILLVSASVPHKACVFQHRKSWNKKKKMTPTKGGKNIQNKLKVRLTHKVIHMIKYFLEH